MDAVHERIEAFHRIIPDARGECHGKFRIVEELEDHLGDERVLSFFLEVIEDNTEFDLARVEALKILRLWKPPSEKIGSRVGQKLASMLPSEEDVLVQQWAAIAAENFVKVPEVFAAVAALLADPSVDLDVRYNCLSAVQRLRGSKKATDALRSLVWDTEIGTAARRVLAEWEAAGSGDDTRGAIS